MLGLTPLFLCDIRSHDSLLSPFFLFFPANLKWVVAEWVTKKKKKWEGQKKRRRRREIREWVTEWVKAVEGGWGGEGRVLSGCRVREKGILKDPHLPHTTNNPPTTTTTTTTTSHFYNILRASRPTLTIATAARSLTLARLSSHTHTHTHTITTAQQAWRNI